MKLRTKVRGGEATNGWGGGTIQHNQTRLKVKTKVRAGTMKWPTKNHNQTKLKIRRIKGGLKTKFKAGAWPCKWYPPDFQ